MTPIPIVPGQWFGDVVATKQCKTDAGGNRRWKFTCRCGRAFIARVSNVTYNLRRYGRAACLDCQRKEPTCG